MVAQKYRQWWDRAEVTFLNFFKMRYREQYCCEEIPNVLFASSWTTTISMDANLNRDPLYFVV